MDRATERRLIAAAQQGDDEAFATLYRAHVQAIYRYIYHRVQDTHLAEDLTGDVFMRAVQGLSSYTEQGRPFIAWLYRIAHARVVDHYRRVDRRPVESDIDAQPLPVDQDMDAGLVQHQAAEALRAALATLTPDQQHVIILRFIEGYRIEQVASLVGKNANAVKALQHRALRALAKRLEATGLDIGTMIAGLS